MGVMKKGRRKITVSDKSYVWYIGSDYDSPYHVLNIVSDDKALILSCPLKTETAYITASPTSIAVITPSLSTVTMSALPVCHSIALLLALAGFTVAVS